MYLVHWQHLRNVACCWCTAAYIPEHFMLPTEKNRADLNIQTLSSVSKGGGGEWGRKNGADNGSGWAGKWRMRGNEADYLYQFSRTGVMCRSAVTTEVWNELMIDEGMLTNELKKLGCGKRLKSVSCRCREVKESSYSVPILVCHGDIKVDRWGQIGA